jgi:hypothetical protein
MKDSNNKNNTNKGSNDANKSERVFLDGCWIEKKSFDNGQAILKLSILKDRFIRHIESFDVNDKGYLRLVITKRKEVGRNGETHSMYLDEYWKKPVETVPSKPVEDDKDLF